MVTKDGRSTTLPIQVDRVSPGLFTPGASGLGVALANVVRALADGSRSHQPAWQCTSPFACTTAPIDLAPDSGQVFVELYGTGISAAGTSGVSVRINEVSVEVLYAGPAPGVEGLDQVNIYLPHSLIPRGYVKVILTAGGKTANPVWLQLR